MPDSEDPQPPSRVEESRIVSQPTDVTEDEYHILADEYMEAINEKAEAMQEAREDVEVEFSVRIPHLSQLRPFLVC
jgi:frataxin